MKPLLALALLLTGCTRPASRDDPVARASGEPFPAVEATGNTWHTRRPGADPSARKDPPAACPDEMALVRSEFCIDRWESITVDDDGKQHSPYHSVGGAELRAASRPGHVPQAYISMEQADLACTRAGKRLCTTADWVEACRGGQRSKRLYPYGAAFDPNACNTEHSTHPVMLLHEGKHRTDLATLNDPRINQLGGSVAPTGAFERCQTPEGVHDMVGNLLEWTRSDRPLLMGGYYFDSVENGHGCTYVTMLHGPQYHDFTSGFRCCKRADTNALSRPKAEPDAAARTVGESGSRDPVSFRSFENAFAKLPKAPPPPAYEPGAPCPVDMALIEGTRCGLPVQVCKRWLDPPDKPRRSCAEFAQPTRCSGRERKLRFCADRFEFTPPGYSLPLVHVSYVEAQTLCQSMDKRLCEESEWEFACEGPQSLPYPYGYVRDGSACNHDLPHALFTPLGKLIDRRLAADALPRCKSPFGVFNIVGNVDEWTTRTGDDVERRSILRGGWWLRGRNRCRAATDSHGESYAGPQTGFRCCKGARK